MSRVRRKSGGARTSSGTKKQKTIDLGWKNDDEHIDSEEEEEAYQAPGLDEEEDDVEEEETLDAKKVRLAREYLRKLETAESDESSSADESEEDEDETEHDRIGVKLQRQRLKMEGTLERAVADKINKSVTDMRQSLPSASTASKASAEREAKDWIEAGHINLLRGHDLTPTCVALQASGSKAISGSKDHSVILWDVEQERRDITLCPTWKKQEDLDVTRTAGEVLSVACSDDGRYAAVGRRDATVSIFDIRSGKNNLVKTFTGHKGPITSLAFRTQSLQMFSGSDDRCIRYVLLSESSVLRLQCLICLFSRLVTTT